MTDHTSTTGLHPAPPADHRRRPLRSGHRLAAVAVLAVALGLAACSSGSAQPTSTSSGATSSIGTSTPSGGGTATITIHNFAFSPSSVTVAPGATVTVSNKDGVAHTITAQGGAFNTGDVGPDQSTTFTAPDKAGSYPYYCSIHQYMTGTLTVS